MSRYVAEPGAGDEILHHHVHDIGRGDDRDAAVYDAVEHIDLDDPRVLADGYKEKKHHIPDDATPEEFAQVQQEMHLYNYNRLVAFLAISIIFLLIGII